MSKRPCDDQGESCQRQRTEASDAEAAQAAAAATNMTAAEATAAAEAEGLPLVRSATNQSGFKYVQIPTNTHPRGRPYAAAFEGRARFFASAEGAALSYARHIGRESAEVEAAQAAVSADRVDLTAAEALAAAEAEGLPLIPSQKSSTGFMHVSWNGQIARHQYMLRWAGKHRGYFATPEEAALSYSRSIGREAAEAELAAHVNARVDMTAEEATAAAEAEDLPLIRSQKSATGFKYITHGRGGNTSRPYQLQVGGRTYGSFATAEEAALSYSRRIGREAAQAAEAEARVDLTAEEALAAAEAEGLPLIRADTNRAGFKHVRPNTSNTARPYSLFVEKKYTASFATAEEAALSYSRRIGREAAQAEAAQAAEAEARVDMTAEEAVAAAEAEGLPLIRSQSGATGFKYITHARGGNTSRPYQLQVGGRYYGSFATAEEAALSYSRRIGREAAQAEAAEARVDLTAGEALAAAEAEGLPLLTNRSGATGYKHVSMQKNPGSKTRPYVLNKVSFVSFATAEEAALSYSRLVGRVAAEAEATEDSNAKEAAAKKEADAKAKAEAKAVAEKEAAAKREAGAKAKEEAKAAAKQERETAKEAAKEARAREKEAAKAAAEEARRQQALRAELMAQRQRAMLQEAAERQRQRTAARPGPSAPPAAAAASSASTSCAAAAEPGDVPTAALIKQVLRDRASAHLCLGLDFFAPRDVVRKRYLALVLRLHPDKVAHPRAPEAFAAVEAAFRRLCGG